VANYIIVARLHWFALVEGAGVRGKCAHDARLIAVLLSNDLAQILTL
jgi:hypothetical protein